MCLYVQYGFIRAMCVCVCMVGIYKGCACLYVWYVFIRAVCVCVCVVCIYKGCVCVCHYEVCVALLLSTESSSTDSDHSTLHTPTKRSCDSGIFLQLVYRYMHVSLFIIVCVCYV